MTDDYLRYYACLEIAPGCEWTQLRDQYRLLAKRWHPDHFRDDREKAVADEKIKEINQAFNAFSVYYKANGRLPLAAAPNGQSSHHTAADTAHQARARADTEFHYQAAPAAAPPQPRRRGTTVMAALVLTAVAAYLLWPLGAPEPLPYVNTAPVELPPIPVQPHPLAPQVTPVSTAQTFFTIGSTLGEVHTVQGNPSRVEGEVWYYGNSKVYFRNGRVERWHMDPATPINARLELTARTRAERFAVGSSLAEVRAAQGEPTRVGHNVWDYGVSRVYFREGYVTGFDNSPLNPLKVRN